MELFDAIDQPWGKDHGNRWVAFSIDGKYCYPSDGSVIDAEARQENNNADFTQRKTYRSGIPRQSRRVRKRADGGGVRNRGLRSGDPRIFIREARTVPEAIIDGCESS